MDHDQFGIGIGARKIPMYEPYQSRCDRMGGELVQTDVRGAHNVMCEVCEVREEQRRHGLGVLSMGH